MKHNLISIQTAKFAGWKEWFSKFGFEFAVFFLIFFFAIFASRPEDIPANRLFNCPFKSITGLDCPGCGLTRAFIAICHANFAEAFRLNALSYIIVPFFLYRLLRSFTAGIFRKYLEIYLPVQAIIVIILIGAVYAFGRIALEIGMRFHLF
ncbi:MAG: hypothetical protein A2X45_18585 [Lentisphaerae bacterium GWF2_50_93]|nr:MAG: hypothetical protein A2X45_18585 [Lentisphaerae bacterium GWF2_50_93]